MKKDIDYYRRQDSLEIYKLIPLALFIVAFAFACFYLLEVDRITIGGITLWGPSKYVWVLAIEILIGLMLIFAVGSLVYLLWIHALGKHGGVDLRTLNPIFLSLILLMISFAIFELFNYSQTLILNNIDQINKLLKYHEKISGYWREIGKLVWFITATAIAEIFALILFFMVRAPFNAKEHADLLKEHSVKNDKDHI